MCDDQTGDPQAPSGDTSSLEWQPHGGRALSRLTVLTWAVVAIKGLVRVKALPCPEQLSAAIPISEGPVTPPHPDLSFFL